MAADQQISRLNRLVGDLLDVSRIQAGKMEVRLVPCDLATIVREAVEEQRLTTPTYQILLDSQSAKEIPVIADADRIKQVIGNYLTNAVKFTPSDQAIEVFWEMEPWVVRLAVRDQGPGLPIEEQPLIWERFHQAPGTIHRGGANAGLGLGLYISRLIISLHHGNVGVESIPGKGATFWFSLPMTSSTAK